MAKTACAHYYLLHCLVLITGTQANVRTQASGVRIRQTKPNQSLFVTINKGSPKTLWECTYYGYSLPASTARLHAPTHPPGVNNSTEFDGIPLSLTDTSLIYSTDQLQLHFDTRGTTRKLQGVPSRVSVCHVSS